MDIRIGHVRVLIFILNFSNTSTMEAAEFYTTFQSLKRGGR